MRGMHPSELDMEDWAAVDSTSMLPHAKDGIVPHGRIVAAVPTLSALPRLVIEVPTALSNSLHRIKAMSDKVHLASFTYQADALQVTATHTIQVQMSKHICTCICFNVSVLILHSQGSG